MNRIFFSPGTTGGGNPTPPRRKFLRIETNPEVKLIEGAKHKKVDLDSLIIQFHNSFNVFKGTSIDCIDYLHKYVSNKIVEAVANGSLTQLYLDTHPTLGHGKFRKAFQLPPLVGGDVKPLQRIGDEIAGMITMKERTYDGSSRDLKVIANFLEYIEHASVKEADHNFADGLIIRNIDPEVRSEPDGNPDFARWSHALRETFSRDGIYNALSKCSSENPEQVRHNAVETIKQLMYARVPHTLEKDFVLGFLKSIEDLFLPEGQLEPWKVDTFLGSFKHALEGNNSLKDDVEIREYFDSINKRILPLIETEDFQFSKYSYDDLIRLITTTGATILAGALFI